MPSLAPRLRLRLRSGSRRGVGWRLGVPVVAAAAGLLLVTSAVTARGTDLRASRTLQTGQLVQREQHTVAALTRQAAVLRDEISAATALAAVSNRRVRAARRAADRLAAPAGLSPVTGPGLSVSLDDAPRADAQQDLAAGARPDDLVIHQQDVQGVVNALWVGGAEAMTIMGQRVIGTTAVRCVGNTLLLHGRVFSPPYTVVAVGPVARMQRALGRDADVQVFRQYVAAYGLRYRTSAPGQVTLPAYAGSVELPLSAQHEEKAVP